MRRLLRSAWRKPAERIGVVSKSGEIKLRNTPAGDYEMHIWAEGADQKELEDLSRRVHIAPAQKDLGTIHVHVSGGLAPHKNKFGEHYRPESAQPYGSCDERPIVLAGLPNHQSARRALPAGTRARASVWATALKSNPAQRAMRAMMPNASGYPRFVNVQPAHPAAINCAAPSTRAMDADACPLASSCTMFIMRLRSPVPPYTAPR